jgi:hypothetical protein
MRGELQADICRTADVGVQRSVVRWSPQAELVGMDGLGDGRKWASVASGALLGN